MDEPVNEFEQLDEVAIDMVVWVRNLFEVDYDEAQFDNLRDLIRQGDLLEFFRHFTIGLYNLVHFGNSHGNEEANRQIELPINDTYRMSQDDIERFTNLMQSVTLREDGDRQVDNRNTFSEPISGAARLANQALITIISECGPRPTSFVISDVTISTKADGLTYQVEKKYQVIYNKESYSTLDDDVLHIRYFWKPEYALVSLEEKICSQ
ncbi:unnamed protein product [Caenorhabditis auriculariae]|uniref:Uncharacterized protein n=1 Tax=Caenorhabditis auriculariae TaxID=2777116 RepID=A0A8S1GVX9_9PELO|nr:unnamed protein product [Caenorhabditis auriculariae]